MLGTCVRDVRGVFLAAKYTISLRIQPDTPHVFLAPGPDPCVTMRDHTCSVWSQEYFSLHWPTGRTHQGLRHMFRNRVDVTRVSTSVDPR